MINNTKFFPILIIIVLTISFNVEARHHRLVVPEDSKEWTIGSRAYMSGNYRLALKYIRPLAKQGHSKAQSALAWMYETGRGVDRDYEKALIWFTVAIEYGSRTAPRNLYTVEKRLNKSDLEKARKIAEGCIRNLGACPQ
tara:strand:- start:156 stop:575 length:420 start_codon:yes stop_codon:yes gene_type:complete